MASDHKVRDALSRWHEMAASGDLSQVGEIAREDVVFRSPVAHTPYHGCEALTLVLHATPAPEGEGAEGDLPSLLLLHLNLIVAQLPLAGVHLHAGAVLPTLAPAPFDRTVHFSLFFCAFNQNVTTIICDEEEEKKKKKVCHRRLRG